MPQLTVGEVERSLMERFDIPASEVSDTVDLLKGNSQFKGRVGFREYLDELEMIEAASGRLLIT